MVDSVADLSVCHWNSAVRLAQCHLLLLPPSQVLNTFRGMQCYACAVAADTAAQHKAQNILLSGLFLILGKDEHQLGLDGYFLCASPSQVIL